MGELDFVKEKILIRQCVLQFLSRPFVVGDRIDIASGTGAKFATGFVERVDPIYTVLRTDSGLPVTIPNKVPLCAEPKMLLIAILYRLQPLEL